MERTRSTADWPKKDSRNTSTDSRAASARPESRARRNPKTGSSAGPDPLAVHLQPRERAPRDRIRSLCREKECQSAREFSVRSKTAKTGRLGKEGGQR